jgi:predicted amino acid dehydrogenase
MDNNIKPIVWMVHPRNFQDIEKGMPILKKLPSFLKLIALLCTSPYKVSAFDENGQPRGFVVAVPLLPMHFQKYKSFSTFRLDQAFKLAKKLSAEKVSVGGMITTLAEKAGLGKKYGMEVFDGTDLLAQVAAQKISQLIKEQKKHIKSIGIIGATTKTGSRLSKYLSTEHIQELHLFAKTVANVRLLADECRKNSAVKIIDHVNLDAIGECDICILTAFIPETGADIVSNLKRNSTFLSIIEPVSPFVDDIEKRRSDIQLTRGITIKAPSLAYAGLDFVIPSGNAFSCLAEALVADTGHKSHGPYDIEKTLRANNFQIA